MVTSHTQLSGPLWAFIESRVHVTDPRLRVEPPTPFEGAEYYLLASLLQKAIRRGEFTMARRAAHHLFEIAPERLWFRLMVIALEDVGIGDPEVAVQMVALSTRPRWRGEFGGDLAVLDRLVAEACASVKDRSADYVYALISEGHPEQFPKAPPQASRAVLLTTLTDPRLPTLTRMDAAVRAAALEASVRPLEAKLAGLEALFAVYRELGCPPLMIDACKAYTQRSSDILPLVIPLVWAIWREQGARPSTTSHDLQADDLGGGMPSYAFDPIHTRLGKRAVRHFLENYIELPWTSGQVVAALWNIDGARCKTTLTWPEGDKLRTEAEKTEVLRAGGPERPCEPLMAWVTEQMPMINEARRIVWRNQNDSNE